MAKTYYVQKDQMTPGDCVSPFCSHDTRKIKVGEAYKHLAGGSVYHADCEVPVEQASSSVYVDPGDLWPVLQAAEAWAGDVRRRASENGDFQPLHDYADWIDQAVHLLREQSYKSLFGGPKTSRSGVMGRFERGDIAMLDDGPHFIGVVRAVEDYESEDGPSQKVKVRWRSAVSTEYAQDLFKLPLAEEQTAELQAEAERVEEVADILARDDG